MKSITPKAARSNKSNRNNLLKKTGNGYFNIINTIKRHISTINQFIKNRTEPTGYFGDNFRKPTATKYKSYWCTDCSNEYCRASNESPPPGPAPSIREAIQKLSKLKKNQTNHYSSLMRLRGIMAIQDCQVENLASELYKFSRSEVIAGHWDSESFPALILLKILLDKYNENLLLPLDNIAAPVSELEHIKNTIAEHVAEAARMLSLFCWVRHEEPPLIAWKMLALACDLVGNYHHSTMHHAGKFNDNPKNKVVLNSIARTILLSLADPYSMKSNDIYSADKIISYNIYSVLTRTLGVEGKVFFDLSSGSPIVDWDNPPPYSSTPPHVIRLNVSDIAASVLAYAVGKEFKKTDNETILARHIVGRWLDFSAPRYSLRKKANVRGSFICGINSIIRINRKNNYYNTASKSLSHEISPEPCFVRDFSSQGYAIHLQGKGRLGLTSGLLAEVDLPLEQRRALGVVKWIRRSDQNSTGIGISILATKYEPVPFRLENACWQGGSSVEFGLLARDISNGSRTDQNIIEIIMPHNKMPFELPSSIKLHAIDTDEKFTIQQPLIIGQDFILLRAHISKH